MIAPLSAGRGFVVYVEPGDRDVCPAELLRGLEGVVAGEDLVGAPGLGSAVDDDRPVLAVDGQRFGDGVEIARARVAVVRGQLIDRDGQLRKRGRYAGESEDTGLQPHAHHRA